MKTYNSYWVWYRDEPFISILALNQKDVEQFIVDWCMSNNIKPSSNEWIIRQVDSVVSKETIAEIGADIGSGAGIMNPMMAGPTGKGYEPVRVKMHPRCF
jgi:hypothetical protein